MALPMLVNGADCGPINPLQGLAKRFDQDRGIQQDQFVAGQAGPSRETFRTAQHTNPALEQEAARFFSANGSQGGLTSSGPAPNAFDLSLLHNALPVAHTPPVHAPSPPMQMQIPQAQKQRVASSWAADFLQQTQSASGQHSVKEKVASVSQIEMAVNRPLAQTMSPGSAVGVGHGLNWTSPPINMIPGLQFAPQTLSSPSHAQSPATAALWDKEFQSHEASLFFSSTSPLLTDQPPAQEQQSKDPVQTRRDADDLARTAGLLVETVKDEPNPKFKNSLFLRMMRGLRDGDVVVDGNDMIERSEVMTESGCNVKGKGKERAINLQSSSPVVIDPSTSMDTLRRKSVHFDQYQQGSQRLQEEKEPIAREDSNETYFRQDNEEYIDYWNGSSSKSQTDFRQRGDAYSTGLSGQQDEWGALQESWDSFEATTWGVKPVSHYQFQPHNPYLMGDANQTTKNHMMHSERALYESVLELEAEVQRNPTSASAWYDLGVKQQENEREPKAILALKRALELDPTHLPSWIALAISHTNESDRDAADDAVEQWVRRNPKYERVVTDFFKRVEILNGGTLDSLSRQRRHDELIHCLMAMARSGNENGDVDADVQIALAVLLNTSEDYFKAQDCFKAALSVRPDDWQLYNRVGATLANSGLSDDAFQYYYRALELNPTYIRARFNLGISCMNMRRYEEAAQYILDALIMQDSDGSVHGSDDKRGITSSTLWDSLRTSCLNLQRADLAALCDRKDLDGFRREFQV